MRRVSGRKYNRNLNIFVMAILLVLGIVFIPSVIHKSAEGTEIVPYINDGTVDWNNIHSLYIYSDGYYGRSLEEPLLIENANTIEDIVRNVVTCSRHFRLR